MAHDVEVTRIVYASPSYAREDSAVPLELRTRREPDHRTMRYLSPPLLPAVEVRQVVEQPQVVQQAQVNAAEVAACVVARGEGVPVSLEYGELADSIDRRLVILREPDSQRARAYRLLRHRLLSLHDPRIVSVTSARPGEGKTTCALNLALALTEDWMARVLFIDANLRRPALSGIVESSQRWSLGDALTRCGRSGPPYPVVAVSGTHLHAAAVAHAPLEGARLDRGLLSVVLDDLRRVYDYIVIDSAAVFESGDVDVIAECSSAVILTARAGRSRKEDMRRAIAQLTPAPIIGSVLIDA